MGKGGPRVGSGRPPDPNAFRRDRYDVDFTRLPASGRPGRPPAWPLGSKASARERKVWTELWKLPQAIMWEQLGQQHLVGLYVRRLVEAEASGAKVTLSTLVRQMADSLGLTVAGMRTNRWVIEAPREEAPVATHSSSATGSRARLRVVDPELDGA